jgi:hypothetical protein
LEVAHEATPQNKKRLNIQAFFIETYFFYYLRLGTERDTAPWYNWRGRPILYSGSEIISFHCAIQPTVRAKAKIAVNNAVGTPMAR